MVPVKAVECPLDADRVYTEVLLCRQVYWSGAYSTCLPSKYMAALQASMTMGLLAVQSSNISLNTGASILSWRKTCCRYCILCPFKESPQQDQDVDKQKAHKLVCVNVAASQSCQAEYVQRCFIQS